MVGYLISQGLRKEQEKRGDAFPAFYREFLRDTGRMTLDDLIRKHMGMDPAGPDFWNQCLDVACSYIAAFKDVKRNCQTNLFFFSRENRPCDKNMEIFLKRGTFCHFFSAQ